MIHAMRPDYKEFCRQSKSYQLLSLSYQVPADRFTPISLFERFDDHCQAFLLESVVDGTHFARYSIMGRKQLIGVVLHEASAEISVAEDRILLKDASPVVFLKRLLSCINMPPPEDDLPYRCALTGYFSYDFIRYFETLPDTNADPLQLPASVLMAPEEVIIFDHLKNEAHLIINVLSPDFSSDRLKSCLQQDKQPVRNNSRTGDASVPDPQSSGLAPDPQSSGLAPDAQSSGLALDPQSSRLAPEPHPDDQIYAEVYHQAASRLEMLYQTIFMDQPHQTGFQPHQQPDLSAKELTGQLKPLPREKSAQATSADIPNRNEQPLIDHDADKAMFLANVLKAKQAIRSGDIFQVVLSKNFTLPCTRPAFSVYRALRAVNPSPYLFFLRVQSGTQPASAHTSDNNMPPSEIQAKMNEHNTNSQSDEVKYLSSSSASSVRSGRSETVLVGASPEMLIKRQGSKVETCPIAGTRPRGKSADEDDQLAAQLLADSKEAAEHAMLVDLSRNDIGRISQPGSVAVTRYRSVEKFSHVMHLVSLVEGKLSSKFDSVDALAAVLPAGTLSGAPKIRAMEIIDEFETTRRGPYGGAVGYIGFDGLMDTCITIRTAVIKDRLIHIRSGAGIVADSDPEKEYQEVRQKAGALMAAIEKAVLYQ